MAKPEIRGILPPVVSMKKYVNKIYSSINKNSPTFCIRSPNYCQSFITSYTSSFFLMALSLHIQ